jgi:hypothetical protein
MIPAMIVMMVVRYSFGFSGAFPSDDFCSVLVCSGLVSSGIA